MKPDLGPFNIGQPLLDWLEERLPLGSTILELGSGVGTEHLAARYKVFSVEHNEKWVGKFSSTYIHAPIVDGWYDISKLQDLPEHDLLLIDGPPGAIGRNKFAEHLDLFCLDVPIVVDDVQRPAELGLARELSEELGRPIQVFPSDLGRSFAVLDL